MGLLRTLSRGVAFLVLSSLSDGLEDAWASPDVGLKGPALFDGVAFEELLLPAEAEGVDVGLRLALLSRLLDIDAAGFEAAVDLAVPVALLSVAGSSSLISSKALLIRAFRSPRSLRSSLM